MVPFGLFALAPALLAGCYFPVGLDRPTAILFNTDQPTAATPPTTTSTSPRPVDRPQRDPARPTERSP
eukprot:20942-Prymnesium_polylepis.1